MRALLRRLFGIDPRALAALRIAIALLLLIDLGLRALDFSNFYTDAGLLPFRVSLSTHVFPLHAISGAAWYQGLLFAVAAAFALLLLVGRFTRVATIASWAMLVSLQTQSAIGGYFADEMLRMVLFWCMFVPLARVWSLDARRNPPSHNLSRLPVLSVGTAGLLLQIASIYFFTGLLKTGPDWWETGNAIEIALARDWNVKPFGAFLARELAGTLEIATYSVLAFEIIGPLLLFSPFATRTLRVIVVALLWIFQLGLGLSIYLENMPWISSLIMLPFLPDYCWDRLEPRRETKGGPAGTEGPTRRRRGLAGELLAAGFLVYVLAFNIAGAFGEDTFPKSLGRAGNWLRINQKWAMFSPNSPREDGWYVIPGRLKNETMVNLWWTGPRLSWEKPPKISALHRSERWATYEMRLTEPLFDRPEFSHFRRRYAEWHCHRWNETHSGDEELLQLEVVFVDEFTHHDLSPPAQVPRLLYALRCSDGDYRGMEEQRTD